ncbi:MAG: phosphatase [Spirochaetales bacterium]|nr:phosphatase [Candidatus Physcosoma equi]
MMIDLVDLHTHTVMSGHAFNTLYEMAKSASEKGLGLYGVSDHGPAMEGAANRFYFIAGNRVPEYMYGVRTMFGIEFNIIDFEGNVDVTGMYTKNLQYGIASLHDVCINPGTMKENTWAYIKAMANPHVNIIGHPDDGTYEVDMDTLAKAAKDNHILLELNENSVKPSGYRKNSRENSIRMLEACEKYGTKVIIGSDAHIEYNIGNHKYAHELLQEVGFPEELVVNKSVEETLEALKRF